jgi:predicted nuclease of predicted toxin-antitoxin system
MMRIKLDENIPARAAAHLRALGHDADTVLEEGLGGREDAAIWAATQGEGRFFITQDMDFSDARKFAPGTHHGVMLVRIPEEEQPRLPDYLAVWFSTEDWQSWDGAFVVATPHKLRISPP